MRCNTKYHFLSLLILSLYWNVSFADEISVETMQTAPPVQTMPLSPIQNKTALAAINSTPKPINTAPAMTTTVTNPSFGLKFQVIEAQFILDNSNIKSAKMLIHQNGTFAGLEIELKDFAVQELQRLTDNGLGRTMNMVINNRIISAPSLQTTLGKKFIIASIRQEEALAFINLLKNHRHAMPPRAVPVVR